MQDRCDQYVRAEHVFVLDRPRTSVVWVVDEERSHRRNALIVSDLHLIHKVRADPLAKEQDVTDLSIGLISERPHLVRPAGHIRTDRAARQPIAVEAEEWTERSILEP